MSRWHAVVYYRSEEGSLDVEHDIEELEELQSLIERGPNWNAIIRIEVVLARRTDEGAHI